MIALRCRVAWILLFWAWTMPLNAIAATPGPSQTDRLWRLAAQEQAALEQRGVILHNASLTNYLQQVVARLWEQVHTDLSPPNIRVIMDTRMEAYAYPNGYCYLTTGILNQIETEDQLAMIIAHELVHYVRQHTAELYGHFKMPSPETSLQYTDRPQMASRYAMAKTIDAAESQADKEGLSILMGAGYCQAEVLTLMFNLMKSVQNQGAAEAAQRLQDRTVFMKKLLAQAQGRSSCSTATGASREFYLSRIAPALIANAQAGLRHGDWDQADRSVTKFLVLKPNDALAYYLKGEILRGRNDGDGQNQSARYYEKALNIDPKFALAHRALGELHFKAGRYGMAKPFFETFLSLAPQDDASDYIKGYVRQCQDLQIKNP